MNNYFLGHFIKAWALIYRGLAFFMVLAFFVSISILIFVGKKIGNFEYPLAFSVLVNALVFLCWSKIFYLLKSVIAGEVSNINESLRMIGKYLCLSFSIDLLSLLYSNVFFDEPNINWQAIKIPSFGDNTSINYSEVYFYVFKIIKYYGEYLTPTIHGLPALVLGLLLYLGFSLRRV